MAPVKELALIEQPSAAVQLFERLATDPNASVEKIERLMALWERGEAKTAEKAFFAAMAEAQKEMRPVREDASNPQTRSRYASYEALDRALRPIYTKHGFGMTFNTAECQTPDTVRVVCKVVHTAGHSEQYQIDMPADGKGAKGGDVMTKTHATGSGTSYGMRYLLKMIFNVAIGDEDDDGNGADAAGLDQKAVDWIAVAEALEEPDKYTEQKAKLLEDYGNKASNLPPAVRNAFNRAKARVMPRD